MRTKKKKPHQIKCLNPFRPQGGKKLVGKLQHVVIGPEKKFYGHETTDV